MTFLPWWLGAPALAVPTVAFFALLRRPMGVSGSIGRVLHARESLEEDRVHEAMADEAELERALREATLAEFGEERVSQLDQTPSLAPPSKPALPLRLPENALFLGAIMLGGLAVTLATGGFHPTTSLSDALLRAASTPLRGWLALAVGGVLVGFGVRISGGCTSGHGLSGCSRLSPPSFVATLVFLGGAVVTASLFGGG